MQRTDLDVATRAARAAASVIRPLMGGGFAADWKGAVDPVTDVDRRAERACLSEILTNRPGDTTLSEEDGGSLAADRVWVVDPLDGTVNFVHGLPHVAVSVALLIEGRPSVGVVVDVGRDHIYRATRGSGAFANGDPIEVSATSLLSEGLISTGFGYDRRERSTHYARVLGQVLAASRGIRRTGSAALDLCLVASGRYDAHWEEGLKPWDVAAGVLIIEEAGGRVTTMTGAPHGVSDRSIAASNGRIHDELLVAIG